MADEELAVVERGVLTVPEEVWALAVRRAEVIAPLAALDVVGWAAADAAAEGARFVAPAGVRAGSAVAGVRGCRDGPGPGPFERRAR